MTMRVRLLLLTIALVLLAWSLTAPEPPRRNTKVMRPNFREDILKEA